jgi:hypothetical protein
MVSASVNCPCCVKRFPNQIRRYGVAASVPLMLNCEIDPRQPETFVNAVVSCQFPSVRSIEEIAV